MSRKIVQDSVWALLTFSKFKRGNTQVIASLYPECYSRMFLHGNEIISFDGERMFLTTRGWNTPTTLSRLNGLPDVRVWIQKGQMYLESRFEQDGDIFSRPWSGNTTPVYPDLNEVLYDWYS